MPYEIEAAIIGALSALVGAGIGGFIAWKATSSTNRLQRLTFVDASLLRIAEIAIEYPYLDNDTFCADYPDISDKESKERYENFCVIVFNTMNVAFDVCKGEHSEILKIFPIEEMIRRHYRWWQSDRDNLQYDVPFRRYIQTTIDDLMRRRVIS